MKRSTLVYLLVGLLLAAAASETLANTVYPGETATGRMAGPGSTHELSVDLVAGDAVRLKVKAKGAGDQAPAVTVTDPAGTVVANASGRRSLNLRIAAAMVALAAPFPDRPAPSRRALQARTSLALYPLSTGK